MKIFIAFLALFVTFYGHLDGRDRNLEPLQISKLVCDQIESPLEQGNGLIQFSWVVTSSIRGAVQHAYRIEVASTAEKLSAGTTDFWSSDKIISDETMNIPTRERGLKMGNHSSTGLLYGMQEAIRLSARSGSFAICP